MNIIEFGESRNFSVKLGPVALILGLHVDVRHVSVIGRVKPSLE
jgi:hypothetical protein